MIRPLLIALIAGAVCGTWFPLPESPTAASVVPRVSGDSGWPAGRAETLPAKSAWPESEEDAGAFTPVQADAALREMLDEAVGGGLSPQDQGLAVALLAGLIENDESRAAAFIYERRLPAWLLSGAWMKLRPPGSPLLREALLTQSSGEAAAQGIVESTAATDPVAAGALKDSLPAVWRRGLQRALLLGVAASDPASAFRQSGMSKDLHHDIIHTAAQKAPIDATIRMMLERVSSDFSSTVKSVLGPLRRRDAALTRRLITESGDKTLLKALDELDAEIAAAEAPPASASLLNKPEKATDAELTQAAQALAMSALTEPEKAKQAWAQLPDGEGKQIAAMELATALAEQDLPAALKWADAAEQATPGHIVKALAVKWWQIDGPAAVRAVLERERWDETRVFFGEVLVNPRGQFPIPFREALLEELTEAERAELR